LKYLKGKQSSNFVKLFLNYGVIDERFVKDNHFSMMMNLSDNSFSQFEIFQPIEWLLKIYTGEI